MVNHVFAESTFHAQQWWGRRYIQFSDIWDTTHAGDDPKHVLSNVELGTCTSFVSGLPKINLPRLSF